MSKKIQFTRNQEERIISLCKDGKSASYISKILNINRWIIKRFMKEKNILREPLISKEGLLTIIKLYNVEKKSMQDIAKIFKVSSCSIARILRNENIRIRRNGEAQKGKIAPNRALNPEQIKEVIRLYIEKKINCPQIAKQFNVSGVTILNYLKKNNIKTRSSGESQIGRDGKPIILNKKQTGDVIRLYTKEYLPPVKIGERFNVSWKVITRTLKRAGVYKGQSNRRKELIALGRIDIGKIKFSRLQKKDIIHRYVNNLESTISIGKSYNCSNIPIIRLLKSQGVKLNQAERIKNLYSAGKIKSYNKDKKLEEIHGEKKAIEIRAKMRPHKLKKIALTGEQESIVRQYANSKTITELSKLLNVNNKRISRFMRENNLKSIYLHRGKTLVEKCCIKCKRIFSHHDRRQKICSLECYLKSKELIEKSCPQCHKIFLPKSRRNTFCSNYCYEESRYKNYVLKCLTCHNDFRTSHKKKKYCSKKCYLIDLPRKTKNYYLTHPEPKSGFKKGQKNWNVGLTKETDERLRKRSEMMKGATWEQRWGEVKGKEARKKASENHMAEKSHFWQGGISFIPYPITFNKSFKKAIRIRDGFNCMKCNMREEDSKKLFGRVLVIHHANYRKEQTIPENCCAVCTRCNAEVNFNRKSWQKFFQNMLSERYGYNYSENGDIILNLENSESTMGKPS